MYSELVIAYLFLGGASGGAFLVMSLWSLMFHSHEHRIHDRRLRLAFRSMKRLVYPTALVMLAVSLGCLFADLKVPGNALLVFLKPHPTPLTFGAFALMVELAIGLMLVVANNLRPRFATGAVKAGLEVLCVFASLAVMAYTAVYLFSQRAVPLWNSPWIIPLFLCSSASSGISVVLLRNWFIEGRTLLLRAVRPLQKAHIAVLLTEVACLAAFSATTWGNSDASESIALLSAPGIAQTVLVGVVGMGLVAPLLLESYSLAFSKQGRAIPISDVVCLIGGFCLRWCLIMGGAH